MFEIEMEKLSFHQQDSNGKAFSSKYIKYQIYDIFATFQYVFYGTSTNRRKSLLCMGPVLPLRPPACGVSWQDGTPGKKYLQVVASGTPACLERPTTTATSLAGLLASGS